MLADLRGHLALIEEEFAASLMAPLSARRALLCAVLLDAFADRAFAADPDGAEDVIAYRARLRRACPALGAIFDLCAQRADGPRLVVKAVEVPIADYPGLGVEDFMVSLYNANSVQRVLIAGPDGERQAHEVLREAVAWWAGRAGASGAFRHGGEKADPG